jgi:aryl-alcohol dehydrogenase-like predicted oxidoreductase
MAAGESKMLQNIEDKHDWHKFVSTQCFYNLLYREEEREMFPYCQATGVGLLPWSPLAAGVLTHPWADRSDKREQVDVFLKALFRSQEEEAAKAIVGRVEIAGKKGISVA